MAQIQNRGVTSSVSNLPNQKQIANAYNFGKGEADAMANEAEGLYKLGNSLADVGVAANKIVNTIVTSEAKKKINVADSSFYEAEKELIDYSGNLQLKKPGEGQNLFKESRKAFDEMKKRYAEQIDDPEARELFELKFSNAANDKLSYAKALELKNVQEFSAQNLALMNRNATDSMYLTPFNPENIKSAEDTIIRNTLNLNASSGLDIAKDEARKAVSSAHLLTADKIANRSPLEATEYIKMHGSKMDPAQRDAKLEDLKDKAINEKAEKTADALGASGLPFETQVARADKIPDPKVKTQTLKLLESREKQKVEAVELAERDRFENKVDEAMRNPEKFVMDYSFSHERQNELLSIVQKSLAEKRGDSVKTDFRTWKKLDDMEPSQLAKEKLENYQDLLTTTDLKYFSNKQKESRSGGVGIETTSRYVTDFVKSQVGYKESSYDDDDNDRANFYKGVFETELKKLPKEKRTDINELNKIRDSLLLEMETTGFNKNRLEIMYENSKDNKIETTGPAKRPSWAPKNAEYKTMGSKTGWVYTDGNGQLYMRVADGETYPIKTK